MILGLLLQVENVSGSQVLPPNILSNPIPRKNLTQIQNEAYSLQKDVLNKSGRLTDSSNDGNPLKCLPSFTGQAPNPFGVNITTNSTWDCYFIRFSSPQIIYINSSHPQLHLTITNSKLDASNMDGLFNTQDYSTPFVYLWDGITAAYINIQNSTLYNASSFVRHTNIGGVYRVGATIISLTNVTIYNFSTFLNGTAITRTHFSKLEHLNVTNYNWKNSNQCAFNPPASSPSTDNPDMGYSANYNRFINGLGINTGCAIGDDLTHAKGNYFEGGFLQVTFGADFQHGTSANYVSPFEFLNWTHNYANGSLHTVFGFYGTSTGQFGGHFGKNVYGTIYANYVNNSKYIPIQSSGNQSGVRIIGNYIQGQSTSFTDAILTGGQNHDSYVGFNYLWNMDTIHNIGITVGFAAYNITVSNNIIFDVGAGAIEVTGMDLKYKFSNGTEASDYSWKGNNVIISDNYISGGTHSPPIFVDSGYIKFYRNVVINPPSSVFEIEDGWNCHPIGHPHCSYVWVDWIDGFPKKPSTIWPVISSEVQSDFWIRSLTITKIMANPSVTVALKSSNTYYGFLSFRCVFNNSATFGITTNDSYVYQWSGHSCGNVEDLNATNVNTVSYIFAPFNFNNVSISKFFNITGTPSNGNNTSSFNVYDFTVNSQQNIAESSGRWSIIDGHSFVITTNYQIPFFIGGVHLEDAFILLLFITVIILFFFAVFWIRKHRGMLG